MTTRFDNPSVAQFEREISLRLGRGDLPGAAHAAGSCRRTWPSSPLGWLYGSMVVLFADDKPGALALIDEALAKHPRDVQCLLQKAEVLLGMGRREEALGAAAAANANARDVLPALGGIADFLIHAREYAAALEILNRAIAAAAPGQIEMLLKRAAVHRFVGHFALSAQDYEEVLRFSPGEPEALKSLSELRPQTAEHHYMAAIESALAAAPHFSEQASMLHFAQAKSLEDLGQHQTSWQHLVAGNGIARRLSQYDSALDDAAVGQLLASFPATEGLWPDTTGEAPIFIVGLPRSGTTLIERVLSSHSQVHGAGELAAWTEAQTAAMRQGGVQTRDWVQYASSLPSLDAAFLARDYLARARAWRGTRPRFCDKQTLNFFHCALILRAFPQARIIHVTRHPMASCYALYKALFPPGTYRWCYDLQELGNFYLRYRKVMAHWHRVLPGRMLDVAYEDMVAALEPTTRKMLDFLGLPFEEPCLAFHLNPAASTTSSSVQARQPLYASSLEQWRHYETGLAPLRAQLATAGIAVD